MNSKTEFLYRTIGMNIKRIRKENKLGQQGLADKISLSRSSLSNIETGTYQPSIITIYEIAEALNCKLNQLLPSIERFKVYENIEDEFKEAYNNIPQEVSPKAFKFIEDLIKKESK
ncbi:helix-turn-helix transcriptional regulator [Mangrovimonas sp. DI 80]|uniref:helix-turn-helix transcriptional regulator n=1 Tax=Mangrovimonas sp. DI 80 TaxID=1779330 RepID=UPI000975A0D3|nr:helix-turn-helix transcriptional regulator [Mangrovimonas sp. DI 80]OMP31907.1 hypothetical protein BKM32_02265 [Mangrovimonas sp. DI 80]